MANALTFDLLARDRGANKTVRSLGDAFDKTGRSAGLLNRSFGVVSGGTKGLRTSFGLLGKGALFAAGAAGIGSLVESFKGIYEEGRQSQKVAAQTAAVIKSTGGVAKISAGHVAQLSQAISNKVGVDDEAIQSGANLLLTFSGIRNEAGKNNKIFDQATQTVTDMTAAMNGGKVTQEGLRTTAIAVGKALQNPIRGTTALRKVGVALTDQQVKQIRVLVEHGKTLDAQRIILGELNKEFGGSAAAGTNAMEKLGVAFDNIKESIGSALLPYIDKAATWLSEHIPKAVAAAQGAIGGVVQAIKDGLSGDIPTTGGVFRWVALATQKLDTFSGWVKDTAVPAIVGAFSDVKTKIEESLPTIDLSALAKDFADQAKGWSTSIIAGIKTGLDTGDWSGLGNTIGSGLVSAIGAAGSFVKTIAQKIGDLLSKVDWVGIGIAVGKQVPSLLVGLAAGIINFDLGSLLKGLAAHWQEVLFAVLSVAFAPARLIGKVAEILGRVPLVGTLLRWAFEHFAAFSKGLVKMVGDALGFMGRAFIEGFRRVFPGVGVNFLAHLRNLPTYVQVVALETWAKARLMLRGLADTIARGIGGVVAKIGELIARMIRPFVTAASWLIEAGRNVVRGLLRGLVAQWTNIVQWLNDRRHAIASRFSGAIGWLTGVGGDLIRGLFSGMRTVMTGIGKVLGEVKDKIVGGLKSLFHISSPSKVMAELGGHMITGLIKGLLTNSGALARTVKNIGGTIGDIFGNIFGSNQIAGSGSFGGNNQDIVRSMAATLYGWTGAQWTALHALLMGESGFNNNAQNPTSTAYGMFQFLNSTWAGTGVAKTSDPGRQTLAGLRYIASVYGNPVNAFSAWLNRVPHWYDQGGWLPPGLSLAMNGTGRPERIRTGGQEDALIGELRGLRRDLRGLPIAQVDERYVRRTNRYINGRDPSGW